MYISLTDEYAGENLTKLQQLFGCAAPYISGVSNVVIFKTKKNNPFKDLQGSKRERQTMGNEGCVFGLRIDGILIAYFKR